MDDDDDEDYYFGVYEGGHWVWDEQIQALLFICDNPPVHRVHIQTKTKLPTGTVKFKDEVDIIEQIRYRRLYRRRLKIGEADVITLQDIKDLALFTAPTSILTPKLIRMLHTPTIERFLRALILYCAYYLQTAAEMSKRMSELISKVRTLNCDRIENEFQDNLADLRLLVAKEYCMFLIGGGDMKKYHHMGQHKYSRSLSDMDERLFETFVRMSIQIVWIALGRKCFYQIECETHRILKSDLFNPVEHSLKTEFIPRMEREERSALFGHCIRLDRKLRTRSPLLNDVFCQRPIDYRLLGLAVVNYPQLSPRLKYLYTIVAGTEEDLANSNLTLGIIGLPRVQFDTILRLLPPPYDLNSKSSISLQSSRSYMKKVHLVLPPINIPHKEATDGFYPPSFPDKVVQGNPINKVQLKRWLKRLKSFGNCTH
ncbi:protein phosphatase 1 regulatory subunit 36 [Spodoptera frugiperda]|uniref:Protein phosphatase 1 regulatory subunit 36 n=1 Tax=Spodoptera frugiperda TaxID=7108 RepID=A0A9R0F5T5_SPOFR|nr:protein phosphatase 1 regulatory subunit 36 [Spodoptera frugiperda]